MASLNRGLDQKRAEIFFQVFGWLNELLSSGEEVHGPRKDRGSSEELDTHELQIRSPTDKSLIEKPKYIFRGPEEQVGPRKIQQPSGSFSSPHQK
ncbi:hypothetical protein O181_019758 [Austropuccinia psidii MF-1]|uniref:Uncharacterized protein n=1 Tax=Austropuccinia psidii MF-1 TaxID=1389203 RepID=A0A9Q3CBN0_9BASI|nr:hypothetical protein [Austropuccinia psidii MF-1]